MSANRSLARWAGLLYGVAGSVGPFCYLYVPGRLIVENDALATADRVRTLEGLLRQAIWGELFGGTVLILATLALYELFKNVDRRLAMLMAAMMLVSVPIQYVNTLFHIAPLVLLKNPAIAGVLDQNQIAALVSLFLRLHNYGLVINQIFWGLWLIPIGMLILRSGLIPRWLAYPLFAAGTGYVLNSLGTLLLPPSQRWITENLQILGVGEVPFFTFYLLIWGVRGYRVDRLTVFLVLLLFVKGIASLVLLFTQRIDAVQYTIVNLVSLIVVFALVMRWRATDRTAVVAA